MVLQLRSNSLRGKTSWMTTRSGFGSVEIPGIFESEHHPIWNEEFMLSWCHPLGSLTKKHDLSVDCRSSLHVTLRDQGLFLYGSRIPLMIPQREQIEEKGGSGKPSSISISTCLHVYISIIFSESLCISDLFSFLHGMYW